MFAGGFEKRGHLAGNSNLESFNILFNQTDIFIVQITTHLIFVFILIGWAVNVG